MLWAAEPCLSTRAEPLSGQPEMLSSWLGKDAQLSYLQSSGLELRAMSAELYSSFP